MGGKQSTHSPPRERTLSDVGPRSGGGGHSREGVLAAAAASSSGRRGRSNGGVGPRARSFGQVEAALGDMLTVASSGRNFELSDSSSLEGAIHNLPGLVGLLQLHSLPAGLFSYRADIVCPVCKKSVPSDDVERHIVMCLTKPRVSYNDDLLVENKGECIICFEEMAAGDMIARLPCLCIYHKTCIEQWFQKSRSCPEHPLD